MYNFPKCFLNTPHAIIPMNLKKKTECLYHSSVYNSLHCFIEPSSPNGYYDLYLYIIMLLTSAIIRICD